MQRILIIEDEAKIRAFVVPYLLMSGYEVDEADNGDTGLAMALSGNYSLILLDLMLPGTGGIDVCKKVRASSHAPVIMLTAKSEEKDILAGFDAGADDYLTKPFSPKELVARIRALLSRCAGGAPRAIRFGGLSVCPESQKAELDGQPLTLTPKEFDLLLHMARSPARVFSRDELLAAVWGSGVQDGTRTVDTHVKQLREKLGDMRGLIVTVWGRGYKLES